MMIFNFLPTPIFSVLAQFTITVPTGVPSDPNVLSKGIIPGVIQLLLTVSFVMAFIFLLWGGISWSMSGGNKEALESARQKVTHAVIGLVVVLLSFLIVYTVGDAFGLNFRIIPLP